MIQLCHRYILVHSKRRQSLWIYMTVIVENMQTVREGLHVLCKIANVDDFDNLAVSVW